MTQVNVQDVTTTAGHIGTWVGSDAGTNASPQPTSASCMQVNYIISQHYRGGKPKGFWPMGTEADQASGTNWGATSISNSVTAFKAFVTAMLALTSSGITLPNHVAVSFFSGSTPNTDLSKWAPRNMPAQRGTSVQYTVSDYTIATIIASQRRRYGR